MESLTLILFLGLNIIFNQDVKNSESEKYLKLAIEKEHNGDETKAMEYLDKSLSFDSKNTEALEERGDLHIVLADYDEALKDYETALELNPTEQLNYKIAVVHSDLGEDIEVLFYIEKALDEDFEKYEYYYYRGLSNMRLGNHASAISDFTKADKLHKNDHLVYYQRAMVHYHLHHYQLAINDLNKAIQIYPSNSEYYNERALASSKLGNYAEAVKDFTTAIDKGDDLDCYLNRGVAYDKLSKYTEAEVDFRHYFKINPNNPAAQYQFGLVEYHAQKNSVAKKMFDKVIEAEPKNSKAYYYRALVLQKLKKNDEACQDIKMCKKLGYIEGYNKMKKHCK